MGRLLPLPSGPPGAPPPVLHGQEPLVPAETLSEPAARLSRAQRLAGFGYWEWSAGSDRVTCSDGALELLGFGHEPRPLGVRELLRAIHRDDRGRVRAELERGAAERRVHGFEHRIVRRDGQERFLYLEFEAIADGTGGIERLVGIVHDVTDRRLADQRIRYLAYVDAITGLPNRACFDALVRYTIENARRHGRVFALLSLDLDNFCRINDSLGHQAGDQVLREVAGRLRRCVRHSDRVFHGEPDGVAPPARTAVDSDTVTRLGGDEFVIIVSQMKGADDGARAARRIEEVLSPPFCIAGTDVSISGSIGIAVYPTDGTDPETLLQHADAAMHHAKAEGGNGHQFFTPSLNSRVQRRFTLETALRKALERQELVLFYQPKIDIRADRTVGVEALIRWESPQFGLVSPLEFITIAEETGLIMPIGDWVIREACRQATAWSRGGLSPVGMSVNLSAAQFRKPGLVKRIAGILHETGLDPRLLDLELTEGLLMDDTDDTARTLRELAALGLSISIDDFGTGYSSLGYLRRFPISCLKIDRSFVREITTNADDAAIVNATIAMAHSLRMQVVAEGVEEDAQLAFLRNQGCDVAQGFLFGRPSPAAETGRWLKTRQAAERLPMRAVG